MRARGDCGARGFDAALPGLVVDRAFIAEAGGLADVGAFIPLHIVVGEAAPAPLARDIIGYLGTREDPLIADGLREMGLVGQPTSTLYARCPLSVASASCPSPRPAPWLHAAAEARVLAASGLTGWMPPREETTSAVRTAAAELYAAGEAAAAWRADKREAGWC